jgi:CheY-specific phosphatase CheX
MKDTFQREKAAQILQDCISSVLAEMAFMDALPSSLQEPLHENKETLNASIDILTPLSCNLEIATSRLLCERIIDILYFDTEETVKHKLAEDTLLEILNIIAGQFLSAYFGQGAVIQLELPRLVYIQDDKSKDTAVQVLMDVEGEHFLASLSSVRYRY